LIFEWDLTDACGCFIIYHFIPFLYVKSLIWHDMFGSDLLGLEIFPNFSLSFVCGLMFPGFKLDTNIYLIRVFLCVWGGSYVMLCHILYYI